MEDAFGPHACFDRAQCSNLKTLCSKPEIIKDRCDKTCGFCAEPHLTPSEDTFLTSTTTSTSTTTETTTTPASTTTKTTEPPALETRLVYEIVHTTQKPSSMPETFCMDFESTCEPLKNFCPYKESLRRQCPKTCGVCKEMSTTTTTTTTTTTSTTSSAPNQAVRQVLVSYHTKGEEVRTEKTNDIGSIHVPNNGPVVLSAVLNMNIRDLEWDDSFGDEDNIMFQILKGPRIFHNCHPFDKCKTQFGQI